MSKNTAMHCNTQLSCNAVMTYQSR